MTWDEKLEELRSEGAILRKKLADNPDQYTAADGQRAEEILKGVKEAEERVDALRRQRKALDTISGISKSADNLKGVAGAESAFQSALAKALRENTPRETATKSLLPGSAPVSVNFGDPFVADPRGAFSLENVIGRAETSDPTGSYLRQTTRTNAAATVANGAPKPTSTYEMEVKTWRLATVAHLTSPFPKQWLSDYAGLEDFLGAELAFGLDTAVNQYVLHGGVDEDGKAVVGVLDDEEIPQTSFKSDALLSLRSAIGSLDTAGVASTGIVLHPDDWEQIETLKDSQGRYILPLTPNQQATRTLWGLPVTLDAGMAVGKAVVGNLKSMGLITGKFFTVGGLAVGTGGYAPTVAPTIQAFESGAIGETNLVSTNQVVIRAEARIALMVPQPNALRVVDLAV